jgi:hypothetical protein
MVLDLKKRSVAKGREEEIPEDERKDAITTGVFVDVNKPEYTEQYAALVKKLGGPAPAGRA